MNATKIIFSFYAHLTDQLIIKRKKKQTASTYSILPKMTDITLKVPYSMLAIYPFSFSTFLGLFY